MTMDKRIAYGCILDEAIEIALKAIDDLSQENRENIRHFSIGNGIIWGELRPDGWRVYRPKITPDEPHLDEKTIFGSYKSLMKALENAKNEKSIPFNFINSKKLPSIENMNPVQIAFALVTTPRTIETVEFILEEENYGSGSREEWKTRLSDLKSWYEELKSIDSKVRTK